jgi:hypothetical protein
VSHFLTTFHSFLGVVTSLIKHANDGDRKVKSTILEALTEIGRNEPNLILSKCKEALETGEGQKVISIGFC